MTLYKYQVIDAAFKDHHPKLDGRSHMMMHSSCHTLQQVADRLGRKLAVRMSKSQNYEASSEIHSVIGDEVHCTVEFIKVSKRARIPLHHKASMIFKITKTNTYSTGVITMNRKRIHQELDVQEHIEGVTDNTRRLRAFADIAVMASQWQAMVRVRHHRYGPMSYECYHFHDCTNTLNALFDHQPE